MKLFQVEKREDYQRMTIVFYYEICGLRFTKILPQEAVFLDQFPWWVRATKWLIQRRCNHSWKETSSRLNGQVLGDTNTIRKSYLCGNCGATTWKDFQWLTEI